MTILKLILTAFFWAMQTYLGKHIVEHMSPASAGAWRFLIAGSLLTALVWPKFDWARFCQYLAHASCFALIGVVGFTMCLFQGLSHTSPLNAALIMAIRPVLIMLISRSLNKEKITRKQALGALLSIFGVILVLSYGSLKTLSDLSFQQGDFLVLIAALLWAIYSAFPKHFMASMPPDQIAASTLLIGGIFLSILALATENDFLNIPPASALLAISIMAIFGSVLAYLWWLEGLQHIGAGPAATFMNLVPVFAMIIGVVLGEPISKLQLIGTSLIFLGIFLASHCSSATQSTNDKERHKHVEPCR